jgi:hypothetical protein
MFRAQSTSPRRGGRAKAWRDDLIALASANAAQHVAHRGGQVAEALVESLILHAGLPGWGPDLGASDTCVRLADGSDGRLFIMAPRALVATLQHELDGLASNPRFLVEVMRRSAPASKPEPKRCTKREV